MNADQPTATARRRHRIRVAQVVTRFIAGAGGVALRGIEGLDPDRFEVTVLTGTGGRLLDQAARQGCTVRVVPELVPQISPRSDWRALQALSEILAEGYDVVHTHSAKAGVLGRVAAHRSSVPLVVHTYHGFPFHEFQAPWRRAAYVAIERRLRPITGAFLAVGGAVAAEAVRRGIATPHLTTTILPAVAPVPAMTPAARIAARRRLRIPPGSHVVGTVGRLDYQKAPEQLVDAVAALHRPDVVTVWIGDGPQRARIERHIERRGLTGRFWLLGDRADVAALLPAFDVFALASRYEGLPCAAVEAMSCGLPVVATAVNAVPELVVPGRTGLLVSPERPDQLAAALRHLLDNPRRAEELARAGRASLGDRFSAAELGRVLTRLYTDGVPSRIPGPRAAVDHARRASTA